MASVLVVFRSRYGQSENIAHYIEACARCRGHESQALDPQHARAVDLTAYDAVVLVAPIYFGRHAEELRSFVRQHHELLALRPLAFVSVSNAAGSHERAARCCR